MQCHAIQCGAPNTPQNGWYEGFRPSETVQRVTSKHSSHKVFKYQGAWTYYRILQSISAGVSSSYELHVMW